MRKMMLGLVICSMLVGTVACGLGRPTQYRPSGYQYVGPVKARELLLTARQDALRGGEEAKEIDAELRALDQMEQDQALLARLRKMVQEGATEEDLGKAVRSGFEKEKTGQKP